MRNASPPIARNRSRYVDTLRAVAITRVFLHHTLWISWLAVLFPSMFVMFGLAGAMTAATLERKGPATTVRSRLRRLLPPLWALAAVAIPLMLIHGWTSDQSSPLVWKDLLYWVLPLANPPASSWGGAFASRCGICGHTCGSCCCRRCCGGRSSAGRCRPCSPR